jgi:predicted O-methyltransferase YrrM
MHSGCVVVAYDVRGNREYLVDGFSGRLAPAGDVEHLAKLVADVLSDDAVKEKLRLGSSSMVSAAFVAEPRWEEVSQFLELPDTARPHAATHDTPNRDELEAVLGDPVYMAVEEIPAFTQLARRSRSTCVEIGAAYGGSTALMLTSAAPDVEVVSIDPFVPDSMNGFRAGRDRCIRNVVRAVGRLSDPSATTRWTLKPVESLVAAGSWSAAVDFLYIDGDHRYESVRADFEAWLRYLQPGGTLVIHDSRRIEGAPEEHFARGWPGPTRLARELAEHDCVELEQEIFSMTVWTRTDRRCSTCTKQAS